MEKSLEQLRGEILQAVELLFNSGVMQPSGHGNFSARLPGWRMLLTRKGHIRHLTVDDFAVADLDGHVVSGQVEPTNAEIIPMHAAVYKLRDSAASIVHTHSPNVTAFALAHQPLPVAYEGLLRFGTEEPIPVAGWAPRGSRESVANIIRQLQDHPHAPAVLLANHGLLALGPSPTEAAQLVISMEEAAGFTLQARTLGGEKPFPAGAAEKEQENIRRYLTAS